MLRKLACAVVLLGCTVGLVMAEDFGLRISKIDGDKITGMKGGKFNKDTKKVEGGEEVTLTAIKDVKVLKGGKFNKDDKKFEGGDAVEGGLKNEAFTKIDEKKGLNVRVTTNDAGKVTEIRILAGKKKKDAN